MTDTTSALEIERDYEMDVDGELGGQMLVWWSRGHGHDPEKFIRAVVDNCLENGDAIPRIGENDGPVEMWQHNVRVGDGIRYDRTDTAPVKPRSPLFPVTVLDVENRRAGSRACSVPACVRPWAGSRQVLVVTKVDDDDPMTVYLPLCRKHSEQIPDPTYRLRLVPVGATIMLPAPEEDDLDGL